MQYRLNFDNLLENIAHRYSIPAGHPRLRFYYHGSALLRA